MKKILIITERRADFSRFKPIIKLIQKDKKLDYQLIVTGLHLVKKYGYTINEINKDIIYLVPTGSKMEIAAKKLDMKIACEIFADRNYEDDGNLISRKKPNALITDPDIAKKHVLNMVKNQAINCLSGKQIPCEIDSVCIHGDNESSLATAKSIKDNLIDNGLKLKPLNLMRKFI